MKKFFYILLALVCCIHLDANEYEDWLTQQKNQYQNYKNSFEKEFEAYKKAHDEAFDEYKKAIENKWPTPDVSTKFKFVQYTQNYNEKKVVDYEKESISLEVIAKDEQEAKEKISKMFDAIYKSDVKQAFENDIVEQKIAQKLKQKIQEPKSNQKLIADIISREQQARLKKQIIKNDLKVVQFKGERIYKANIKFPPDSMIKKAKSFQSDVEKQSQKTKMPQELIYAIMHSESSFNPMAKSYIPAFGLMQIVPKTAGVDTYKFLYGKKKLLSSSYLYESDNNIMIGSNYLHILYFRYLKNIKDPQSRLYCTIAAYNTGAGNVAKAFIGNTNIYKAATKINSMSSDEVYKTLMKKLPYNETKKYLLKVTNRIDMYNKLIKKGDLS